jgi:two-component system, NarL family, sensor kinase
MGLVAVALAATGTVLALADQDAAKDPGVLAMNVVIVATFPVVATTIAHHRPGHRISWVFAIAALGAAATVFTYGYARHGLELAPGSVPGAVLVGWASSWVWVAGVAPLVTFGLLVFPDGRLPSRRWRPVAVAAAAGMALMALSHALRPGPLVDHPMVDNPLGISGAGPALETVESIGFALFTLAFLASASSLVVRWRRGAPAERRQLRWLLFAVSVLAVAFAVDLAATSLPSSLLVAGALAFLPLAVGVAIVREHLYDIDVLITRSLVYALLSAAVVATYVVVVAVVGAAIGSRAEFAGPLLATGIVAVAFQPAREAVQRQVSHLVRGAATDSYAALARLARRLEATIEPDAVLPAVVETLATTLRLPYVAIDLADEGDFRRVANHGDETTDASVLLLNHQGRTIGRIVLGQRASGEGLTGTERRLLEDLVRQAGIAVHGVRLTAALQRSRERLVVAREEERRRLHRDLHDGLGPTLAAIALQLDVLRRQMATDPLAAESLVGQLKDELRAAILDIRRLVDGLRPPALDELGLVSALRQQAVAVSTSDGAGVTVSVEATNGLPRLSAATEVAAYRIVMEALTNVLRHAEAQRCTVRLVCNSDLEIEIEDDGCGIHERPNPGVGLNSMRERAAELGGQCSVERRPSGGTLVHARLPLDKR